jgi:hypothetical protein
MATNEFLENAFAMRCMGWSSVIPVLPYSKATVVEGWQAFGVNPPTDHQIARWAALYPTGGVGFVYGGAEKILGVDLDILEPEIAYRAAAITKRVLGPTPLIRVGRDPKRLCLYRYLGESPLPGKGFGNFELFFRTGQTVFAGNHPDTRKPYQWIAGASPSDTRPDAAPVVTHEQLLELIAALKALAPVKDRPGPRLSMVAASDENAASDRLSGAVAMVLPTLKAADDPLIAGAQIIASANPGSRYLTAFGVIVSLVRLGLSDRQIWDAASPAFLAHFRNPSEQRARRGTIASALRWARAEIGPDAQSLETPAIKSLQSFLEAG